MHYFTERLRSFKFAFRGLLVLFQREPNAWIHLLAAVGVIILGIVYEISRGEWALIMLCIALVFALELLNSSIEVLCDALHPQRSPGIRRTKDLAAGAVLIGAIGAFAVACFIFLPKIF
jgi:diacylglycerol kinase